MSFRTELLSRARDYARQRGLVVGDELGAGVHGIVFATEKHSTPDQPDQPALLSALKAHDSGQAYARERDVYLRLQSYGITTIGRAKVPQLLAFDNRLWILEMTIVTRPFLLDFAGAYLDTPPDFSEEVWAEWRAEKAEQFGENWAEVQSILRTLEGYGVYMIDVSPGNISFGV